MDEQMQIDQQIDWYDFVVVEKIDLYDDEEMKMIEEQEQETEGVISTGMPGVPGLSAQEQ